MTRINVGIHVHELCDQHLIAEYRELPRMVAFSHLVKDVERIPFTLGTGHMKSCVIYGTSLVLRQDAIMEEMAKRGFATYCMPLQPSDFNVRCRSMWDDEYVNHARPLVMARIRERLATMKRKSWACGNSPSWVHDLLP